MIKTLGRYVGLGLLLLVGSSGTWSQESRSGVPAVNVSVYDDAGVGLQTMVHAEEVASGVFRQAGVEVRWLNCSIRGVLTRASQDCGKAAYPTNLQLRILRSRKLRPEALGVSYLSKDGFGCYSEIFVEPEEQMRKVNHLAVGPEVLLGYAASHEIGHLLIGTNAHSGVGVMRAHWSVVDMIRAAQGNFGFNPAESLAMRERIAAGSVGGETARADGRMDLSGKD
jgi:hypothetical protein